MGEAADRTQDALRPAPEHDDRARLRRVRSWLGRIARRTDSKDGGEELSANGDARSGHQAHSHPSDGNGHSNGVEHVPSPAHIQQAEEAIARVRAKSDNLFYDPKSVYPPPKELGPQRSQDRTVWADDPRKYLPEGHPERPAKLNSRDDPEYMIALRSMVDVGITQPRPD